MSGMTGNDGTHTYDQIKQNFASVVVHGAVGATPRPVGAASVIWVGSTSPSNATPSDIYLATGGTTVVGFAAA